MQYQVGCHGPGQVRGRAVLRARPVMSSAGWAAGVQARCGVGQSAGQGPSCAVPGGLPGFRPGAGFGSLPGKTRHVQCHVGCHGPGQVRGRTVCRARPVVQARCTVGQSAGQDPSCAVPRGLPWSRPGAGSASLPGNTRHVQCRMGCHGPGQVRGQPVCRARPIMCSAGWAAMVQAKCRVGQSAGQNPSCAVPRGLPWSRPGAESASLPGKTHHVQCWVGCHGPGQVQGWAVCRAKPVMCSATWAAMVQARCGVSQSAGQDPSCAVPGGLP